MSQDMQAQPPAATPAPTSGVHNPCPACGQDYGPDVTCRNCHHLRGLPQEIRLTGPGRRFGAYLLDIVLMVVTLYVGWLVWSIVVWGKGQTPAKSLLGMRVVKLKTRAAATRGTMAVRELLAKSVIGFVAPFTLWIIFFRLLWNPDRQQFWDSMVDTVVVDDPNKQLA